MLAMPVALLAELLHPIRGGDGHAGGQAESQAAQEHRRCSGGPADQRTATGRSAREQLIEAASDVAACESSDAHILLHLSVAGLADGAGQGVGVVATCQRPPVGVALEVKPDFSHSVTRARNNLAGARHNSANSNTKR